MTEIDVFRLQSDSNNEAASCRTRRDITASRFRRSTRWKLFALLIVGWNSLLPVGAKQYTTVRSSPDYSTVLSVRGGSRKSSAKKPQSRRKTNANSKALSTINASLRVHNNFSPELPTVEALLFPRRVNFTVLVNWLSSVAFAISFLACVQTAGRPYIATVFALLNKPPSSSFPSAVDRFLAQRIAASTNDILPPPHLPSPIPLLSCLASIGVWLSLTKLFPRWFPSVDVFMNFVKHDISDNIVKARNDVSSQTSVWVHVPREQRNFESDGKSHVVRSLHSLKTTKATKARDELHAHPSDLYFDMNHRRMYFDLHSASCIDGGPTLHSTIPLRDVLSKKRISGLCKLSQLQMAQERFGPYATVSLPTPTVTSALYSRISSPLAVFQLLGRLLSALEEDLVASLMGMGFTLFHHFWNARQTIESAKALANEVKGNVDDATSLKVWALRPSKAKRRKVEWVELTAVDLLPGDVFVFGASDTQSTRSHGSAIVIPVDALLLEGICVTNEAVLTGESVPQSKLPLDLDMEEEAASFPLDMTGTHRNSVIFAGTTLLHCASQTDQGKEPIHRTLPAEVTSTKFLVLRTGSYSSRGDLLRTLAKSTGHVGAISNPQSEKDAVRLVVSLSMFALMACISLFHVDQHSLPNQQSTFAFRRVIQCTRIAVASIPSDLPLALSAVAQTCTIKLRKEADVVCSEPGSLLSAAHVDVVVFDKTGTLTADTQSLAFVVPPGASASNQDSAMTEAVLAGCHSLISLANNGSRQDGGSELIGDPLDLASVSYSGWSYNRTEDAFEKGSQINAVSNFSEPIKLWQIKSFPFDPNRRTSSALLLVEDSDGSFRFCKVIKGSPDVIQNIITPTSGFTEWYDNQLRILGADGMRTIAMAVADLTSDTFAMDELLQELPQLTDSNTTMRNDLIRRAREAATTLHRNQFEGIGGRETSRSFQFVGLACFDAAVRPSSKRIVRELQQGGVKVTMLTGDGIDAAISVARTAGLISSKRIAILDVDDESDPEFPLIWRMVRSSKRHRAVKYDSTMTVTSMTARKIISKAIKGDCTLVATGKAMEVLTNTGGNTEMSSMPFSFLRENLFRFTIIARSSPKQKQSVVSCLKERCRKTVLMCGDGVNDIAAMKVADVGVALLNGYGDENASKYRGYDAEDERRRQHLKRRKIGSNRRIPNLSSSGDKFSTAGLGNSPAASRARIITSVEQSIRDFQGQHSARQQAAEGGTSDLQYASGYMKVVFTSFLRAMKAERERAKALQKGGGAAARILAEDERLKHRLVSSLDCEPVADAITDPTELEAIKPGEASLAASFSCLRPSIDGVDALMRAGIAASACVVSTQQTMALNCLMSCYNLATLYRRGFRYGKRMLNAEVFFYMSIDQAGYQASCTPRPRLTRSRQSESLFHSSTVMSVCAQAFIHLISLHAGNNMANALEVIYAAPSTKTTKIRWKPFPPSHSPVPSAIVSMAEILGQSSSLSESGDKKRQGFSLLGRPPFRPNYQTNFVFLMSIFQNAVSAMVAHKGKPFYGSILESRQLCLSMGASLLFAVGCIAEVLPAMNTALELRSLPSRRMRRKFLSLFLFDFIGCFAVRLLCSEIWLRQDPNSQSMVKSRRQSSAADEEEMLLNEEEAENRYLVTGMVIIMVTLVVSTFGT